jgi:hypothetical protein
MARTSPNKVRLLREKPKRWMIAKVPTSDTATSMTGNSLFHNADSHVERG